MIAHNRHVQEKILYSDLYEDYWAGIFALHRQWAEYRETQNLKVPWREHSLESFNEARYRSMIENLER